MKSEVLYLLKITAGGMPLPYRHPGGGKFTDYKALLDRTTALDRLNIHYKIYRGVIEWKEIAGD